MLIISLLCVAFCSYAQVKKVPEFSFTRMDNGEAFTQKGIAAGKKTFFIFFDTECPHCMQAISEYNDNEKSLNNINMIMITRDPKKDVVPFLKNFGPKLIIKKNVTVVSDKNNQFIARFLPRKFPSMFLFSKSNDLMLYSDEEKDISKFLTLIKAK
ncbi:MAG: TlpA family protein disulfide reductase [Chitinophagia bacterium]|jgi:thiol-disulfide isomerase/thioredoxin